MPLATTLRCVLCMAAMVLAVPRAGETEERFALVISGATGDSKYVELYDRWRQTLVAGLRAQPEFRDDHLFVLAESPGPGVGRASRQGVAQALTRLRGLMTADSVLLVVLMGHGTFDGVDAKFNLVGPDLEAREWDRLLAPLPGRVVFVNTTAASAPFLERLARENRVVITATESPAQRYDTIFPEFLVQAFDDPRADTDKNDRISVWEAFVFSSDQVRRWYQQQGRLSTERPLLDDTGDGQGREADQPGSDGALASRVYVGAGIVMPPVADDPTLQPLVTRREMLEDAIAELRAQKAAMADDDYLAELERLLVELAQVSREIRRRASAS